jgi:hypothetical protein
MIDNVSLQIEELAALRGSYIEAFFEFMGNSNIHDPEDLLEIISPILYEKIKQEFKNANYFPKGSVNEKQDNLCDFI